VVVFYAMWALVLGAEWYGVWVLYWSGFDNGMAEWQQNLT
jgi:hypothetical protein